MYSHVYIWSAYASVIQNHIHQTMHCSAPGLCKKCRPILLLLRWEELIQQTCGLSATPFGKADKCKQVLNWGSHASSKDIPDLLWLPSCDNACVPAISLIIS